MSDHDTPSTGRVLTAADHILVEEIFSAALEVALVERSALVSARAGERSDIADEVNELLAAHDRAESFLPSAEKTMVASVPATLTSLNVGPYKLLEKIGEGGMGDVYRAERADGLFERAVAIKVVRTSLQGADMMKRFLAERQILASLQHPNIVTLLDAGATGVGQPYIVMELVDGVPLNTYCRDHGLTLDARLRLFVQVCRAVQYAHQRAIVHRDLKPANILVTHDSVPKVLDFGIAKLLETSPEAAATVTGMFPGPLTPNYASPEQLRGLQVTTACDVYSLGILLYEIAAGARPYDTTGHTLDHVLQMVLRTDVVRPSEANASDERATTWRRRLKGDLDAITLRAIAKEPDARYSSAGELGDDLERFLRGKPVVAQEPSAGYMLRRLAARNKATVSIAVVSLVLIISALGVALWQRHEAVAAQARAEERFKEVRQLARALIFKIHDAVEPLAGSTPVRHTIVKEGLAYLQLLEQDSAGDPTLQRELADGYRQIGNILGSPGAPNLGDRSGALKQFEKAHALAYPLAIRPTASFEDIRILANIDQLTIPLLLQAGLRERALDLGREELAQAERALKISNDAFEARDLVARAAFSMGLALQPTPASLPYWQRAADMYESILAAKPDEPSRQRNVALVEKYRGSVFDTQGREDEARSHYRRALELDERRFTRDPQSRSAQFDLAIDLGNMAVVAESRGLHDEAYALLSRSLELRQKLSDSDPTDALTKGRVGYVHLRLATVDIHRRRFRSALEHARDAVRIQEGVVAKTGDSQSRHDLAAALYVMSLGLAGTGDETGACTVARRSLKTFEHDPRERTSPHYLNGATAAVAACDAGKHIDVVRIFGGTS
jgi:non-specific serine/threonine protein kinase/serine/threonine-protein kinase